MEEQVMLTLTGIEPITTKHFLEQLTARFMDGIRTIITPNYRPKSR